MAVDATLSTTGLVTRAALARELGVAEATIAAWQKRGLPVIRLSRKVVVYDATAVAEWARAQAA